MKLFYGFLAVVLVMVVASGAQANLILEPGFEGYTAQVVNNNHPPQVATFPEGGNSTVDDPWRTTGTRKWQSVATGTNGVGTAIGHASDNAAYFGQNNNSGTGYQEILNHTLDVSSTYTLSFWALPFHNPATNGWFLKGWVEANATEIKGLELNAELSQHEWRYFEIEITPDDFAAAGVNDGDQLTVAFQSGGRRKVGVYVDDVSLIPEPAAMLILGVGGVFLSRRKK